jgi:dimethylhistidine N-methyltransferase
MSSESTTEEQQLMLREVLEGLKEEQKILSPKYFYDHDGSELFHQITQLDEYYLTRTEKKILDDNIDDIVKTLGERVLLIEPGSGNSEKTRLLLSSLRKMSGYIPMDISAEFLFKSAEQLQEDYPNIAIVPIQVDYTQPFELPDFPNECRKVVFFPGSTIGNFTLQKVTNFLKIVHRMIEQKGGFFLGVDLIKDREVLKAAYNDREGVTARFNKNMLKHINNELNADFDLSAFEHEAIYNEEKSRIEMHLVSLKDQTVHLNGEVIHFDKGETIHTENSHKYSVESFGKLVEPWFKIEKVWTDDRKYFGLFYLTPK